MLHVMAVHADRLYLSAPSATPDDIASVTSALHSGWLAPVGPEITAFEAAMAAYVGVGHAVALASGTAALHLALGELGVQSGDAVIVPTVTFGATAFAPTYLGAVPVFVDIDDSWNVDPELLASCIADLRGQGYRVAAAIPVDLYGTPANYARIRDVLAEADVPMVEDAAEGLGARTLEGPVGAFGSAGVFSFNGNKIITTSGGGMFVTNDQHLADRIRHLSTQARMPLPWYEHEEIGYNYRMSNILAALGRSQLRRIDAEVARRRQVREWYRNRLETLDGVHVQTDPPWGTSNAWLSIAVFDSGRYDDAPTRVRMALESANIESRPIWKPMHQQPVFRKHRAYLNGKADALFRDGLCLPSGSGVDEEAVRRVCDVIVDELLGS